MDVLEAWEGLVERVEDGRVYARLLRAKDELTRSFDINSFAPDLLVEVGSTFTAQLVRGAEGTPKWRNVLNTPAAVSPELIERWRREVAHFEGSGL